MSPTSGEQIQQRGKIWKGEGQTMRKYRKGDVVMGIWLYEHLTTEQGYTLVTSINLGFFPGNIVGQWDKMINDESVWILWDLSGQLWACWKFRVYNLTQFVLRVTYQKFLSIMSIINLIKPVIQNKIIFIFYTSVKNSVPCCTLHLYWSMVTFLQDPGSYYHLLILKFYRQAYRTYTSPLSSPKRVA